MCESQAITEELRLDPDRESRPKIGLKPRNRIVQYQLDLSLLFSLRPNQPPRGPLDHRKLQR